MATVSIRMPDDMKEALERLATEKSMTVSGLISERINDMLGHREEIREDTPYTLTTAERYLLMRVEELSALVKPEDKAYIERDVEAFQEGYTAEYSRIFSKMHIELSRQDCEFVWDVLDMLRDLIISYDNLEASDKETIEESQCHYQGFDHNDNRECAMERYVKYLAKDDCWEFTVEDSKKFSDRGNSHCQMVPMYQGMLSALNEVKRRRRMANRSYSSNCQPFDKKEIQFILSARRYDSPFRRG